MTEKDKAGSASRHLVRGALWMVAARWSTRFIGLFNVIILARLLAPSDFGVIAIALIVIGLLETMAYAGVDLALMRAGADSEDHYNTAWTIQLIQGAGISLALLLTTPFAASFFSEPRVTAVLQVLAIRPLLSSLQNIGTVNFRKNLDFSKDFQFSLYAKLLNFGVLVSAAFYFRNYWALVIGMTSSALIDVILSYVMHPYRPRLCLKKSKEIWGFSMWLIVSRVGSFLNRKTDEFVVGNVLGATKMGGYHVANELATMPTAELVMPLRRAVFPTLAKVATHPDEFQKLFLLSFSAISVLSFSIGFGLMSVAPELVPVVLGEKWIASINVMRWLAIFGTFSSLILILEMGLWVIGKTNLSSIQSWTELGLLIPTAYYFSVTWGIDGAAMARAGISALSLPLIMYFVSTSCAIPLSKMYDALWRPLLSGLAMAGILANVFAGSTLTPLVLLIAKVLLGVLLYPSIQLLLWLAAGRPEGAEAQALSKASAIWKKFRGKGQ